MDNQFREEIIDRVEKIWLDIMERGERTADMDGSRELLYDCFRFVGWCLEFERRLNECGD